MKDKLISWETSLNKCPYCGNSLHIISLSTRSEKDSIGNVITMSKIHLEKCRGNKQKQLSDIKVKVISKQKSGETITWRNEKMLSY